MPAPAVARNAPTASAAHATLRRSAALWLAVALVGQWLFAVYVASFYGGAAIARRFDRWNQVLVGGYVRGGLTGNLVLGVHLLLAVVITVGGPLQLVPSLRRGAAAFHRYNGHLYIGSALVATLAGLYAVWTRGTAGGLAMRAGISLDGLLIVAAATATLLRARAGKIASHRRWALRTFLLVSGVWFFRVGLMLWILMNRGPVGVGNDFDGPFVRVWAFGCYLVPLAVLQLFLWAQARAGAVQTYVTAALLGCLALATGVGIVGAFVGMWLPHLGTGR